MTTLLKKSFPRYLLAGLLSLTPMSSLALNPETLTVPFGFNVELWAEGVSGATTMVQGDNGTVFVGTGRQGNIYAVVDNDGDFKADNVKVFAKGLDHPTGIAFHKGSLFVAETPRLIRYDNAEDLSVEHTRVLLRADLPILSRNDSRRIIISDKGELYLSIDAPCNACERRGYAKIEKMDIDGKNAEVVAKGIRSSRGFAWHPRTNELWFTDNSRERLSTKTPADEINRLSEPGEHFGFPFCYGKGSPDPTYGNRRSCNTLTKPIIELGQRVNAQGLMFYTGTQFPKKYRDQILVAENGIWDGTRKFGYRVTLVEVTGSKAHNYETFVGGWLDDRKQVQGRPIDLLQLADGSVLIADSFGGQIYRLSYTGKPRKTQSHKMDRLGFESSPAARIQARRERAQSTIEAANIETPFPTPDTERPAAPTQPEERPNKAETPLSANDSLLKPTFILPRRTTPTN